MAKSKRVLVLSDLHCGHVIGLTPPSWHDSPPKSASKERKLLSKTRQKLWAAYQRAIEALGDIDIVVCNGDAIDGRGEASGGSELLTIDRDEQADMAAECIKLCKAPKVYFTAGTPYHSGKLEDFERQTMKVVSDSKYTKEVDFKGRLYLSVNGVQFDFRHKVGASGIPHGRHSAVAREALWGRLWADDGITPNVDIVVRSHVHYAAYSGTPGRLQLTTPALQGLGSKYGTRQCSGIVDWGFTVFDINGGGEYTWQYVLPAEARQIQQVKIIQA